VTSVFCLLPFSVSAQTSAGRLLVTVSDPSGAIIRDAKVTVVGTEDVTKSASPAAVTTSAVGLATLENLPPGRYTIQAEFEGFETVTVKDYRVRAGENRRAITLPIKKVSADMTVGRDKQAAALDPLGNAFSTVLTREQIAALPDDPDEMEAMLKAMAPPGSTIRVDGFSGGKLPPKSQIRSIRLPRMDMFAAQNHGGINGMMFIDITTQPGIGPLRGSTDFAFRDDVLNARNPFSSTKGDEGLQQYGGALSGSLVPNKISFSMSAQGAMQHDTGNLLAALRSRSRCFSRPIGTASPGRSRARSARTTRCASTSSATRSRATTRGSVDSTCPSARTRVSRRTRCSVFRRAAPSAGASSANRVCRCDGPAANHDR
jgi:hypothetical protein